MKRLTINVTCIALGLAFSACGGSTPAAESPETPAAEAAAAETSEPTEAQAAPEAEAARPLNVPLLRSSFKLVMERNPDLTDIFYGHLFADYPESKALFKDVQVKKQGKMLAAALSAVVDHLEDGEWLKDTLGKMGKRHVGYGVKPEQYAWVGASLLKTLAQVAGDDWNDELAQAWGDAYGAIQSLMLAGAGS